MATIQDEVFVVHGHDEESVKELIKILSDLNLTPKLLKDYGSGSETLIELLEKASKCSYVIVLLTPDDLGITSKKYKELFDKYILLRHLKLGFNDNEGALKEVLDYIKNLKDVLKYRPRQNVMFEFGFFRSLFGSERVTVLIKTPKDVEWDKPSDIDGVYYLQYVDSVDEVKNEIINRLKNIGLI